MSTGPDPISVSPNEAREASALSSRRGVAILLLLCLVQFMDVLDASILNIALPAIKRDLDFSQQSLQWVVSGYILTNFDALGAALVTGGVLLLIYALVKAPEVGWGTTRTIAELASAGVILALFVANELRVANPLVPLSILRVKGVAAADATQTLMLAGFFSMFFFLTLYMQTVLHYSPIQTGTAYLPLTGAVVIASGVSSQLVGRVGTKPVIVGGSLIGAVGLYWLSRIPLHGSYVRDILPGLVLTAFGLGAAFVGVATAANAGVGEDKAGLAAGLLNTAQQLCAALGLAILSALATARTNSLLHAGQDSVAQAATHGYQRALMAGVGLALAAGAIALLAPNTRQTASAEPAVEAVPIREAA